MDLESTQSKTGLQGREMPAEEPFTWLTCQLGKWEIKMVHVSVCKTVAVPVFHLKYYGATWDAAYKMWMNAMIQP